MITTQQASAITVVQLGAAAAKLPDFPMLDGIATKLAHGLVAALSATGGSIQVTASERAMMPFADWKAGLEGGVAVARYRDPTIKTGMLLGVPMRLVSTLVDLYYGGTGGSDPAVTAFGAAERRLFDRLAILAAAELTAAWAGVATLDPSLIGTAHTTEEIALVEPGDPVMVQHFTVGAAGTSHDPIMVVYPLAALRMIAGLNGAIASVREIADPAWQLRLSDAVMQSRLPVRTVLARPTLPLSRLLALKRGDVIPVTLPRRVPLTVAGRLLAHGTIGEANGRAALKIDALEPGANFDD